MLPKRLNDMQATRQKKVRELVAYVKERSLVGEAIDIGRAVFAVVLNSISNTFFSVDMEGIQLESDKNFKELVGLIMELVGKPNVSDSFPWLAALDLQGRKRRMESLLGIFHNIFDDIIEQRKQTKRDAGAARATNDLLDSLIECMRVGDGSRPDKHAIKALLEDLFIAGTDTSASTIEWAMAELLRNPKSIEMVQAELNQAIGSKREVDESDIQKLPYLQAVVKETLRLHPPAPFLVPHRAETTAELCGYTIPEGTRVLVNVWAMGRDENVWANAEHFMPERFLGKDIDYKGQDFELIPFGAGRRICPGLPLAVRMIHLVLASLLLPFNWKLPEGTMPRDVDMEERFGLTLAKATPLQAIPVLT